MTKTVNGAARRIVLSGMAVLVSLIIATPITTTPVLADTAPTSGQVTVPAAEATRVITLGTGGGPIARAKRSQIASLVQVGTQTYLIDAGAGVSRELVRAGFHPRDVRTVFLTHLHFDHIAGLAPLLGFAWIPGHHKPIDIYGPPATDEFVASAVQYLSIPEGIFAPQMPPRPTIAELTKSHAIDITAPTVIYKDDKVRVTAVENTHYVALPQDQLPLGAARSYSYRLDTPDRSIVFTGDTGSSPAVTQLAKGADILFSEVLNWDPKMSSTLQKMMGASDEQFKEMHAHMRKEHVSPQEVGKMAAEAGVKMVVLTHVGFGADAETDMRHYTQGVRDFFSGPVVIARDGNEF